MSEESSILVGVAERIEIGAGHELELSENELKKILELGTPRRLLPRSLQHTNLKLLGLLCNCSEMFGYCMLELGILVPSQMHDDEHLQPTSLVHLRKPQSAPEYHNSHRES